MALKSGFQYLSARLAEPSMWRGLTLIVTACGAQIDPEQSQAIIAVGLMVAGCIGAFVPDFIKRGKDLSRTIHAETLGGGGENLGDEHA